MVFVIHQAAEGNDVEPLVIQALGYRRSLIRILYKHKLDEFFGFFAYVAKTWVRQVNFFVGNLGYKFGDLFVKEGLHSTKHHVEHCSS